MTDEQRSLRTLPKGHLHLHLEGSMRRATAAELLSARGVELDEAAMDDAADISTFIPIYKALAAATSDRDVIGRVCRELVHDEAAHGVRHLQPTIAPCLQSPALGTPDDVIRIVADAMAEATSDMDMTWSLLVAARWQIPEEAEMVASAAASMAERGVTAFGLAGDELAQPADLFVTAVEIAREEGLAIVPHAGELPGTASVEKLRDVIRLLRPDRIAHGVRAVADPSLVEALAESHIVCDVCLTSNMRFGLAPTLAQHPVSTFVDAGVTVTLNADDETFFGSSIVQEYERARHEIGFDDETLARIAANSLQAVYGPGADLDRAIADVDAWMRTG